MVGNTIVRTGTGVVIHDATDPGGRFDLDLFNNAVANTTYGGVSYNGSLHLARAGHNAFWQLGLPNWWNGHRRGVGNLHVNPRFTAPETGRFTLRSTSPLIDAGLVCSPGGVVNLDALGNGRLAGASTDIGAFERGAAFPNGDAVVGTDGSDVLVGNAGNDILCGMGGADLMGGFEGDDFVHGGRGPDQVVGGEDDDRVLGGRGSDPCLHSRDGIEGNDTIDGGLGTDGARRDPGDARTSVEVAAVCT